MVKASAKEIRTYSNETAFILAEYTKRKRLAELGFVSPLDDLDLITAECFVEISREIDNIESERADKLKKK